MTGPQAGQCMKAWVQAQCRSIQAKRVARVRAKAYRRAAFELAKVGRFEDSSWLGQTAHALEQEARS